MPEAEVRTPFLDLLDFFVPLARGQSAHLEEVERGAGEGDFLPRSPIDDIPQIFRGDEDL
ncbi:hypothetical protein [Streptomyces sp. NPDC054952]